MSHFCTYVFTKKNGRSVEELLAPYDENITVAPYVEYTREQAIVNVRKEIEEYKNGLYVKYLKDPKAYAENCNKKHLCYIRDKFPKKLNWTDDECYEDMKNYYSEDMIKPNGDLLSTYNPNSKWDWYTVGGRWNKCINTLDGRHVNEAFVHEVNWKDSTPFAFITPIGEWCEKGKMGWWAVVFNEKEKSNWETEFKKFVDGLDEDTMVTIVDCHI